MKIEKLSWRLIIFSALFISMIVNNIIILTTLFIFSSGLLNVGQIDKIVGYMFLFTLFSPLVIFFINGIFVYFYRKNCKLLPALISAFLAFFLSSIILLTVTNYATRDLYLDHDKKVNPCYYTICGE